MSVIIFAILMFGCVFHDDVEGEIINFTLCEESGWSCLNETSSNNLEGLNFDCKPTPPTSSPLEANEEGRFIDGFGNRYHWRGERITEQPSVNHIRDAYINLSNWEIPHTVSTITIQNCEKLTLIFHMKECKVASLIVNNVEELRFGKEVHEKHPKILNFENVTHIPSIPANTIRDSATHSVQFKGIRISSIEQDAIVAKAIHSFRWKNVQTDRMEQNAMTLKTNEDGEINIENSAFPPLMPLSIRLEGNKIAFLANKLSLFAEAAIIIQGRLVRLEDNDLRLGGSVAIVTRNAIILRNRFDVSPEKRIRLRYSKNGRLEGNTMLHLEEYSQDSYHSNTRKEIITQFYETDANNHCTSRMSDIDRFLGEAPYNVTVFVAFLERKCYNQNDCSIPTEWQPAIVDCKRKKHALLFEEETEEE